MVSCGIFANHAHVFPESMNADGSVDRLLKLMDACEIAQAVCFAPFAQQCDKATGNPVRWLADAIKPHGARLVGFGTVDFRRDDLEDQLRQCVDLGMKGLKLHPNSQNVAINDPRAMRVYASAVQHDLFCSIHTGVHRSRLAASRVLLLDEVAWEFPNLRISLEHVGGYHFFHEALAVIFNHLPPPWQSGKCNLFAGLASVFSRETNRFWHLGNERLRELIAQVGAKQCIFGLDFPYNVEVETRLAIRTIRDELGLSAEEIAQVLGGNLHRELRTA